MRPELSFVMPCLDEAKTIGVCVRKALAFLEKHDVQGEVVVADNGSLDGSQDIARKAGARVVDVPLRGYGAALAHGIQAAQGRYVIMGDSDDSYDFSQSMPFLAKLREGYDLVMGNRFRGGILPGAMPALHRYFGNPMLSWLGRHFFWIRDARDLYCGMRGFRRSKIIALDLRSKGMEYALEMVIRSQQARLRITEVPTSLQPDGRGRPPHLRRYRDGWRSLRFYLVMSPRWFFGSIGLGLMGFGAIAAALLFPGPFQVGSIVFDYHTLAYAAAAVVLGHQSLMLGLLAKLVSVETGLHPLRTRLGWLQRRNAMELLLLAGLAIASLGVIAGAAAANMWWRTEFGPLNEGKAIRFVIASVLLLILGGQTMLAGGFVGLIHLLVEQRNAGLPDSEHPNRRAGTIQRHVSGGASDETTTDDERDGTRGEDALHYPN